MIRNLELTKSNKIAVQPLSVRLLKGITLLELLIKNNLMINCINQKHLAGMQTLLLKNMCFIKSKNTNL